MPEWLWALLVGGITLSLAGLVWRAQERRISELEKWKLDKEKFDYEFRHEQFAPAVSGIHLKLLPLIERTDRLDRDCRELRHFKDEILPQQLDHIASENYGTISNFKTDAERRFDRLERKVFNGNHE